MEGGGILKIKRRKTGVGCTGHKIEGKGRKRVDRRYIYI